MKSKVKIDFGKTLTYAVWLVIALNFVFKLVLRIWINNPIGDEVFFIEEIEFVRDNGLWESFSSGTSHLYSMIGYLISLVMPNLLIGLRLFNIILSMAAFVIALSLIQRVTTNLIIRKISAITMAYMIFCCKTGAMFFVAINDALMVTIALVTTLFLLKYLQTKRYKELMVTAIFSGLMFWVRSFSLLVFGGIILGIAVIPIMCSGISVWKNLVRTSVFILISVTVALLVQIPSLIENKAIRFESKSRNQDWAAWNWLTHIERIPSGSIFLYKRPPYDVVQRYLDEHGSSSIPRSIIGRIKADPKFAVDNLVSNLFVRLPFVLLTSSGMFFFGLLSILREPDRWRVRLKPQSLALLSIFLSVSIGLSIYVNTNLEQRWLFIPAVMGILLGAGRMSELPEKSINKISVVQLLVLLLLSSASLTQVNV